MTKSAFGVDGGTVAVALDLQGMAAGTTVMTAEGALPVEFLAPGDRIVTRSGLRVLRGVVVQVVRRAAMVRVGTDTLGVGRPEAEVMLPAGQPVLVRDWRARAMFGQPRAMIPAGRLVDGQIIRSVAVSDVRLYRLAFAQDEVVYAGGLELACVAETVNAEIAAT